jgi:hypothetical protein
MFGRDSLASGTYHNYIGLVLTEPRGEDPTSGIPAALEVSATASTSTTYSQVVSSQRLKTNRHVSYHQLWILSLNVLPFTLWRGRMPA